MTNSELATTYAPKEVESQITDRWNEAGAFAASPDAAGESYAIVIPPPNVTAALHMGHALNNTLQDILIRYHRMAGRNALWMPGTDHAGIATQTVVEKRVFEEEGKRRTDFERDEFVGKIQAWKDQYEKHITDQLKAMGCSCDWDRQRFTMDPTCTKAVREAFFRLFKDELIYRGKRLVNWDPATQTALADDEVEACDIDGSFWYLDYPVCDEQGNLTGEQVTVATTRPETMLGDTAVAVNPNDLPHAKYIGQYVKLPIVNRIIPIVGDDYVVTPDPNSSDEKAKFASGFLKVTPAHDPNDWEIGLRHQLEVINVMAPDGSISDKHGWSDVGDAGFILGQSREKASKAIVQWFKENGQLAEVRPYRHSVGHSYRSHVPVEPYLSDQWYVKVTDQRLAGAALGAMAKDQRAESEGCVWTDDNPFEQAPQQGDGELTFYPPRYAKTFQMWHENLRDWCISRQLWWGHRIPVWTSTGRHLELNSDLACSQTFGDQQFICLKTDDADLMRQLEKAGFVQDSDVLDTWFSSALWPMSTMGWPEQTAELETWNPSNTLCTAREIITLWVSRMVMFNRYLRGCLPFTDVFIHAMIQDGHGQKMSKSLGNGVDPFDIIHSHGADGMRFTLASMTTQTQDVRLTVDMVCPHTGKMFTPKYVGDGRGHKVAAAIQDSPFAKGKQMVSSYGMATGKAKPTDAMPVARNTSEKFDVGRNFANKLWNAVRFALSNLEKTPAPGSPPGSPPGSTPGSTPGIAPGTATEDSLGVADRWILSRLTQVAAATEKAILNYEFKPYADGLYDFIWREVCDWYIEAIKPTVANNRTQRKVLSVVLDVTLRLLHPAMPYITEKLWERLNEVVPDRTLEGFELPVHELLVKTAWPKISDQWVDPQAEQTFALMNNLVTAIRQVRTSYKIPPRQKLVVTAKVSASLQDQILPSVDVLQTLASLESFALSESGVAPQGAAVTVVGEIELYVHDLVDAEAEKDRLGKLIEHVQKSIQTLQGRLSNESYTAKAPAHLVEQTRGQLSDKQSELASLEQQLQVL